MATFCDLQLKAPWWSFLLPDIRPQGDPEWQMFLGRDVLLGLHVRGLPEAGAMLAVRVRDDGWMTALIPDAPMPIETPNYDDTSVDREC